ncbi:hypothetical protein AKH15_07090 [Vibrio parahaemolyticus]|uniref:hypothetical protein n=1 Tax=Vibrio parahaemolyticus TaxID=670 RepID=UPI000812E076|nr:hypothetical protein [Vibrio parahaemolyticus]OCQ02080.1 hypothetical protein AKH15_07090 [Vibrio parahaemolyticus]
MGILLLVSVQLSVLGKSGRWVLIGGNPAAKIEGSNKVRALSGLSMILSGFVGLLVKMVWLSNAL